MAPPFIAYFGMISQNQTLLSEAYNQISLYRNYLRDSSANNLWKHVLLGAWVDEGHWATGWFCFFCAIVNSAADVFCARQRMGRCWNAAGPRDNTELPICEVDDE